MHDEGMTIPVWRMVSVFATKKNIDYVPTEKVRFILLLNVQTPCHLQHGKKLNNIEE